MNLFEECNNWYKGNLHTHTSISDGVLSFEKCIELYKSGGYNFMAITDHRIYFEGLEEKDFTILPSTEFHINDLEKRTAYHIVGIGMNREVYSDDSFTPQKILDVIKESGGFPVIAHPAWSLMAHSDIMSLKGYAGIEIWNTVSETKSGRGDSTGYADVLASKGVVPLLFAVDDAHFYDDDYFGGYIMVNSTSCSRDDIIQNILKGNFYCSQGPEIRQISINAGTITVETSSVSQIGFMSDSFYCENRICRSTNGTLTKAEYCINDSDNLVRIECQDADGKRAWSQFIYINRKT